MKPQVSVIIPAYNEEDVIEGFLGDIITVTKELSTEIIVVDDGSTDKTLSILNGFKDRIKVISYSNNRGKGYAVRKGILASSGHKVVFLDADGATPANEIPKMLKALDDFDMAVGSRVADGAHIIKHQPFYRECLGKIYSFLVNLLFGFRVADIGCGFKGFKGDVGRAIMAGISSDGWEFDVEVFARAKKDGIEWALIPVIWRDSGRSKLSLFMDPARMLLNTMRLWFKIR